MKIFLHAMLCMTMILAGLSHAAGQNVSINADGSMPDPNAMLDIKSATKGILIPRTSSSTRLSIPNTKGLLVYDTLTNSFWFNDGAQWNNLSAPAGTGWSLTGNPGTDTSKNFMGTTDGQPLLIKVNNQLSGILEYNSAFNTGWGYQSLSSNTSGQANTGVGYRTLVSNTGGNHNTAAGFQSMQANVTGSDNAAWAYNSLTLNTTGNENTAGGTAALLFNTSGSDNTAIGFLSLQHNVTGNGNTAVGMEALASSKSGCGCTAVGGQALSLNNGGTQNTALGDSTLLYNLAGSANTAVGNYALMDGTSGSLNTAMGVNALFNNRGNDNTAIGVNASVRNMTGNQNTAVGSGALFDGTFGNDNTAVGYLAGVNPATPVSNSTAIGANARVNAPNTIQLGDGNITDVYTSGVMHASNITIPSDLRLKNSIQPFTLGLQFLNRLNPVTYFYNNQKDERLHSGFIAQDVERAAKKQGAVFTGVYEPKNAKDFYSLSYQDFVMPLVKAVQELSAQNDLLKNQMAEMMQKISALENK